MNKKGFTLAHIIFLIVIFSVAFIYLHVTTVQSENEYKQNIAYVNELADEYIKKIETDGQLTEQTQVEILKKLDGKFSEINIETNSQPVESGEYVYLRINVRNKNAYGGIIINETITVDGKAI